MLLTCSFLKPVKANPPPLQTAKQQNKHSRVAASARCTEDVSVTVEDELSPAGTVVVSTAAGTVVVSTSAWQPGKRRSSAVLSRSNSTGSSVGGARFFFEMDARGSRPWPRGAAQLIPSRPAGHPRQQANAAAAAAGTPPFLLLLRLLLDSVSPRGADPPREFRRGGQRPSCR